MNILITSSPNASKIMSELIIAEAELNALRLGGIFEFRGEVIAPTIKQRANNYPDYQLEFPKRKRKFTGPVNEKGQHRRIMLLPFSEDGVAADELIEKVKRSEKALMLEERIKRIRAALIQEGQAESDVEPIIEDNIFETIAYLEYELGKNLSMTAPSSSRLMNQLTLLQSELDAFRKLGIFQYEGRVVVPTIKERPRKKMLQFPIINGAFTGSPSKNGVPRRFIDLPFERKKEQANLLIEKMNRSQEAKKLEHRINRINAIFGAQEQAKQKELEIVQAKKQYIIEAIAYLENELAKIESA